MSFAFSDQLDLLALLLKTPVTDSGNKYPLRFRKKMLNRGEWRFCMDSKLIREYATGTVSSMSISLPSDCLEIFAFYIVSGNQKWKITNDREISVKDIERYAAYLGDIPFYYVWEDDGTRKITLVGSTANNGRTYNIFYIKKPATELAAETDTSIIPEEFREASVYYAASELLRTAGDAQTADTYIAKYSEYVQRAQARAEQMYMDYDFPRPDFNIADVTVQDVQGGGWGLT